MCHWGDTRSVAVDGDIVSVDACLAGIIDALNSVGLKTTASCCGHGHCTGSICLADGRVLEIHPNMKSFLVSQERNSQSRGITPP